MSLTLRLKQSSTIPIWAGSILPERVASLSRAQIQQLPVRQGNQKLELGALFDVELENGPSQIDHPQITWAGDLGGVHDLGKGMSRGHMEIQGNAGRHLGSQMVGGTIRVHGNADDFVGCEISGGTIRVDGNAGDWVGAAYPGNSIGMNRGQIVIQHNAGRGVGMSMRRGLICVGGSTQRLAGWNMKAGTIMIGGTAGDMLGKGMVRGTIALAHPDCIGQSVASLPPTFTPGGILQSPTTMLLSRWATQNNLPIAIKSNPCLYHGDQLHGGRGEVLFFDRSVNNN